MEISKVREYVISKSSKLGLDSSSIVVSRNRTSYSNFVYSIDSGSKSLILKIIYDPFINEEKIALKESALPNKFRNVAPRILLLDHFERHPAIFMEKLHGRTLNSIKIEDDELSELAKLIANIHSRKIDVSLAKLLSRKYLKVPQENLDGAPKWLKILKKHKEIQSRTLKSYERLHRYYLRKIPPFTHVVCHGDFKLANVLRTTLGLKFLDWEGALVGDPAYDLAVLFYTSDFEWDNKLLSQGQKNLFLRRYLDFRSDKTLERRMKIYYKLAKFQDMCWSIRSYMIDGSRDALKEIDLKLKEIENMKLV